MIPLLGPLLAWLGLIHPTQTVKVPALPAAWAGFDNFGCPGASATSGADMKWFNWCMQNSNVRFAGAYLEGTNLPPNPANLPFSGATKDTGRRWMENVGTLRTGGWGIVFWYVGFSHITNPIMPSTVHQADYPALGKLHAKHARMIVKDATLSLDDAVVYFDNEDGMGTDIVGSLGDYYGAFFASLQDATLQDDRVNPATNLPTLRPGMYVHASIADAVLKKWPWVIIWQDDPHWMPPNPKHPPANPPPAPIIFSTAGSNHLVSISTGTLSTVGTTTPVGRPVGRQFDQGIPPTFPGGVAGIHSNGGLDWDSAAVRDPSYPSGDPRLAMAGGSGGIVIARGAFQANPTQAQMGVDLLRAGAWQTIVQGSDWMEPDAPLATGYYPTATAQRLATFDGTGLVAVSAIDQASPQWMTIGGSLTPAPRRLRALAYALFKVTPPPDEQVYWIASDRTIQGMRNTGATWGAAATVGGTLKVTPAAALALACLQDVAVYLFTVADSGLLTGISWTAASDPWPGGNVLSLESGTSSFLSMGALAAVSPGPKKMFVIGIGTDLTLKYVEYTAGATPAWSAVKQLGTGLDFVFPHSRIATLVVSAALVKVAVVNDQGDIRLHTLDGSGGSWVEKPAAQVIGQPKANAPVKNYKRPTAGLSEPAYGWRINPFGDLALTYEAATTPPPANYTAVYAAGLSESEAVAKLPAPPATGMQQFTALLRFSTDPNQPDWQVYR